MPDREKYIDILSKAVKTVKEFNEDAPIKISLECVEDILTLLKEQPQIVRCKECHYGIRNSKEDIFCIKAIYNDKYKRPDWFCADGEMEDGNK